MTAKRQPHPTQPRAARSIATRIAREIAPRYANLLHGLDKGAWRKGLMGEMAVQEPWAAKVLQVGAESDLYKDIIEEAIRQTRGVDPRGGIQSAVDVERFKRRLTKDRRIVQIRQPGGHCVTKQFRDVTPQEFDALAVEYERSSQSDARRAQYYRECARQMRLAGLMDTDPLSKLLAS